MPPNPSSNLTAPHDPLPHQNHPQPSGSSSMNASPSSNQATHSSVPPNASRDATTAGPSSNKATHGSMSSITAQPTSSAQHHNSNPGSNHPAGFNGGTRSSSWAMEMWLKQAPGDEPWSPYRR